MPAASIVIPSRGGAMRLPRLFESLKQQTSSDWEAIVILDGDIDDSATVVRGWSDEIPVRSIVFPENRGRSAALNAGFADARGDVLIRCDDDLEVRPSHVRDHVARHEISRAGVIGLCRNVLPETAFARRYGVQADLDLRRMAYAPGAVAWRYWAANVSVTRDVATEIGTYDETFRAYGWEDVDWGYRLASAGVPVVIVKELEAVHHGAAATTAIRAQRAFYSGAARTRFEAKHGHGALPAAAPHVGVWNKAVRIAAARLDERRVSRVGRVLDTLLPILPPRLGRKGVALLVESAAFAGYSSSGETEQLI